MEIFKMLMTNRAYIWVPESVRALNVIDIVFSDDEGVRNAWKDLYEKYCISNPSENDMKQRELALSKLIETIAISLGYKDKITWETIQKPYIPEAMIKSLESQVKYQYIINSMSDFLQLQNNNTNPMMTSQNQQGEKNSKKKKKK